MSRRRAAHPVCSALSYLARRDPGASGGVFGPRRARRDGEAVEPTEGKRSRRGGVRRARGPWTSTPWSARPAPYDGRLLTANYLRGFWGASGMIFSRGAMVTAGIARVTGARPGVVGKPSPAAVDAVSERLGVPRRWRSWGTTSAWTSPSAAWAAPDDPGAQRDERRDDWRVPERRRPTPSWTGWRSSCRGCERSGPTAPQHGVVHHCDPAHVGGVTGQAGGHHVGRPAPRRRRSPEQREQRERRGHQRRAERSGSPVARRAGAAGCRATGRTRSTSPRRSANPRSLSSRAVTWGRCMTDATIAPGTSESS